MTSECCFGGRVATVEAMVPVAGSLLTNTDDKDTPMIKTLNAGDRVRLESWTRYPYERTTVGVMTVRAYAAQYNEDPELRHAQALKNGHDTCWGNLSPSVIVGDPAEGARIRARLADEFARCITLREGEKVVIEGERFTVVVPWGNRDAPRNSDAIHFKREEV